MEGLINEIIHDYCQNDRKYLLEIINELTEWYENEEYWELIKKENRKYRKKESEAK